MAEIIEISRADGVNYQGQGQYIDQVLKTKSGAKSLINMQNSYEAYSVSPYIPFNK